MSPRSATSSRALAAFSVARTRSGLAGEDALGTRFEGAALQPDETADAALGDGEERVQPGAADGWSPGIFAIASATAMKPPVMAAVRVPPSAWITSQSTHTVRSPSLARSMTARRARPP